MIFRKYRFINIAVLAIVMAAFSTSGCVEIDDQLGNNLIAKEDMWKVMTTGPLRFSAQDIEMKQTDSLSGYNYTRFAVGSVRDSKFGLCRKGASFTLIPLADTIDFGTDPVVRRFHFAAALDTVSVAHNGQENIIQNLRVYELKEPLDTFILYNGDFDKTHKNGGKNRDYYVNTGHLITNGIPTYSGGDSLSFDFSTAFAEKVIKACTSETMNYDSLANMVRHLPGIYMEMDDPVGDGGRINLFELKLSTDEYNYVTGNYAIMKLRSKYKDEDTDTLVEKDTSFLFLFGPSTSVKGLTSVPDQFAYNTSYHLNDGALGNNASDNEFLYVQGGAGYKPVIKAEAIKRLVSDAIAEQAPGVGLNEIVINKASIVMPFDHLGISKDWEEMDRYPQYLSPTSQFTNEDKTRVSYAGLTDSSVSSENQGDINRSNLKYNPDISHHVQEILKLDENDADYADKLKERDIWMLILHDETTSQTNNTSNNDYYNNLMYNAYYNNLYNGYGGYGYGGYGYGYGGYGYGNYGYSNYYNYLMMAQYASNSSTTTSTSTVLDKDRYYDCRINSCNSENGPYIEVTFSVPINQYTGE